MVPSAFLVSFISTMFYFRSEIRFLIAFLSILFSVVSLGFAGFIFFILKTLDNHIFHNTPPPPLF